MLNPSKALACLLIAPAAALPVTLAVVIVCFTSADASAEFHVWRDAMGTRHISNVPAVGFTNEGQIKQRYNPNSIEFQHLKMMTALAARSAKINIERERQQLKDENRQRSAVTLAVPARGQPGGGIMNLDELIELEKRGGRSQNSPTNR